MINARSILIVDDDWGIRTLLARFLSQRGHTVATAEEGLEGLRQAQRLKPDLIILDYRLPGMDGLTLARMIRGDKSIKHVALVMLTVIDQQEVIDRARKLGVAAYVVKPFRVGQLMDVVEEILNEQGSPPKKADSGDVA